MGLGGSSRTAKAPTLSSLMTTWCGLLIGGRWRCSLISMCSLPASLACSGRVPILGRPARLGRGCGKSSIDEFVSRHNRILISMTIGLGLVSTGLGRGGNEGQFYVSGGQRTKEKVVTMRRSTLAVGKGQGGIRNELISASATASNCRVRTS